MPVYQRGHDLAGQRREVRALLVQRLLQAAGIELLFGNEGENGGDRIVELRVVGDERLMQPRRLVDIERAPPGEQGRELQEGCFG